jgi:hypothetical protein
MPATSDAAQQATEGLTEILRAAVNNEIQVEEAIDRATRPAIVDALPDNELASMAGAAEMAAATNWRAAVKGIRILRAVLDAKPADSPTLGLRGAVITAQIEITGRACEQVPDGRLFQPATAAGELLAKDAEGAGQTKLAGQVLNLLGVLHLDPYRMGGQLDNYPAREAQWRARLHQEYGIKLAGVPAEQLAVPPVLDALAKAGDYFRRALAYRRGPDRARTLKALAQSSLMAEYLGAKIDRKQVEGYVQEALGLLQQADDPATYADLQTFLRLLGKGGGNRDSEAQSQKLLDEPLQATFERLGIASALNQYSAQIVFESDNRGEVALALWNKVSPLVRVSQTDGARADHLFMGLKLVASAYGGKRLSPDRDRMIAAANEIIAAANAGKMNGDQAAGTLAAIAVFAPNLDSEKEGLQIVQAARQLGPAWVEQFEELVLFLEARLHEGAGVNAYKAKNFAEATGEYLEATKRFSDLQLSSAALIDLGYARDAVADGDDTALSYAIAGLGTYITAIQAGTGTAGTEALRLFFNDLPIKAARGGSPKATVITFLWSILKGAAFSAALQKPPAWRWDKDQEAVALLARVAAAEKAAGAEPGGGRRREVLDENEVLSAYTAPDELAAGANAFEVLENTQHAFDGLVNARILAEASAGRPVLIESDALKASLDERTVVVNQLLGPAPDGRAAVYTMLVTREQISMTYGAMSLQAGTVVMTDKDGKRLEGDYLTLPVGSLRKKVIEDDPGMKGELESDVRHYLGGNLLDLLANFRAAGKDHLCFSPHGPTNYYPFHLLSPGGAPLAGEWKVSYIPSMAMLSKAGAPANGGARKAELRAFGVNWEEGNASGLPPLDNAADEAATVAEQFGINAELNEKATRAALLDALQSARMVHVATHGYLNVAAPAFQAICMSPAGKDDGVVRAYELVGLDLRGCDLITLSACETALGRFDRLGNIRGLPATLFMAGARTIIGTLWPVESHCAQYFFSMLYQRLRAGDSKLNAFVAAQDAARKYYPLYGDWGAFYYAGWW